MVDPIAVPTSCTSNSLSETVERADVVLPSIDDVIESWLGSAGFGQLFQAILISLAWAFDAQQTFINVFTDAYPAWRCNNNDIDWSCSSATTSPCGQPKGSWSWSQPNHASIVSEWNLECSPPALVGLPASSYFLGCFAGGLLLATFADSWLGRKNMLFLSCLTMSVSSAMTAFSPNIWVYSAFRFISGMGRANVPTSSLVLAMEIAGRRWRDFISILGFFCFPFGFASLPAVAYLGRSTTWRKLYLWTSIPFFCYSILIYFLVRESPRWLLVRGRRDEAIRTLKRLAKSDAHAIDRSFSNLVIPEENLNADNFAALKILWKKKWAFKRLSVVMVVVFGIGMVYYGMPQNLGNLGSNIYLNVTYNALAELPSAPLTLLLIAKVNRKCSILLFSTISCVSSILCVFLKAHGWQLSVEVVSFFSSSIALDVLQIYTTELFPTCVRNSAISMTRQALVFGAALAPLLAAQGRKKRFLSFGVFGLVIGCCGLFIACLPETRGKKICDTIEEEENKKTASNHV